MASLASLDLRKNALTSLSPEIGQLTNLTTLYLDSNNLTSLPSEIGQLTSLTRLDLIRNNLTAVPSEIVQLTNLIHLGLSGNKLMTVPSEIIQLTNLIHLELDYNNLTAVPPEIGQLTNLIHLGLRHNKLTSLPPEMVQLTNLNYLDLSRNKLETVPSEIFQLTNLTELVLVGNNLTSLPPEIVKLAGLTRLDLRDNKLTTVPPEVVQLTNLTRLDLSGNNLTNLPPEIGKLTSLIELHLYSNNLTSLPPEIGQLASLTSLDLRENNLTSLPPEIGQLKLENFDDLALGLGGNPLEVPPLEVANRGGAAIKLYFLQLEQSRQASSQIERSIEFLPEHHQAGIAILSYFGQVVRQKYPDKEVGITIKQDGTKVAMIVNPPEGDTEIIERTLEDYGLVVIGKMPIDNFLSDPLDILALRNKLQMTQVELEQTKELYKLAEKYSDERIRSIEQEVNYLRNLVGSVLSHSTSQSEMVKSIASEAMSHVSTNAQSLQGYIRELIKQKKGIAGIKEELVIISQNLSISSPSEEQILAVEKELASIKEKNPQVFQKIVDFAYDFGVGIGSSLWVTAFFEIIKRLLY